MTDTDRAPVSIVMVAIGGYGYWYLKTLLEEFPAGVVELRAAVDPFPGRSVLTPLLQARGIPLFPDLESAFAAGVEAELAVIASPIHHHVPQSTQALRAGCHVLCDKPLGATVQEGLALIEERDAARRWIRVGYQWSYSRAVQALKRDILDGRWGVPRQAAAFCLWPRGSDYYARNDWAGRIRDDEGRWVLDSPLNNAMAHFLHNLLYLLGPAPAESARPVGVIAECSRTNRIENYDSVACRIELAGQVELLFFASHAVERESGPCFRLLFEEGEVYLGESREGTDGNPDEREVGQGAGSTLPVWAAGPGIVGVDRRGRRVIYGHPEADHQFRKLFEAVEAVRNDVPLRCGPEAALAQTVCMNGVQESVPEPPPVPEALVRRAGAGELRWVEGLAAAYREGYRLSRLPSQLGQTWSVPGRPVNLCDYRVFPSRGGR
jgi:predicted dehydrogenase